MRPQEMASGERGAQDARQRFVRPFMAASSRCPFDRVEIVILAHVLVLTSDGYANLRQQFSIFCRTERPRFQSCHTIIPHQRFSATTRREQKATTGQEYVGNPSD